VLLNWSPSPDGDFQTFRIYRDGVPSSPSMNGVMVPTLVHETTETSWLDSTGNLHAYYYEIAAVDRAGNESARASTGGQVGVDTTSPLWTNRLNRASPSPFRASTTLSFSQEQQGHVTLDIFDLSGRVVRRLLDEDLPAGVHSATWNGEDGLGRPVPSGIFFARMTTAKYQAVERVILRR